MYKDYKNIEIVKPAGLDLKDRLVGVQRVTKVTKGGRNFGFSAIVVVGDENGAATAKKLASEGYGIIAFHFDRGEAKKVANETIEKVNQISKNKCHYFNTNAASEKTMEQYIPKIKEIYKKDLKKLQKS